MGLSDRQLRYLEYCDKVRGKEIDFNDGWQVFEMVTINLFETYLKTRSREDKKRVARMLFNIRDDLKKSIKLWHLIEDKEEFKELVIESLESSREVNLNAQRRRHDKRDDFAMTDDEWVEVIRFFGNECAYCGSKDKMTYDHFHPFSKGGDFMKGNIVPACGSCNSSKNNTPFDEWYQKKKFYDEKRRIKVLKYVESNRQMALL